MMFPHLNKNHYQLKLYKEQILGDTNKVNLTPNYVIDTLNEGDLLYFDFDALTLKVVDVSTINDGFLICDVIIGYELNHEEPFVSSNVFIFERSLIKSILPTVPLYIPLVSINMH